MKNHQHNDHRLHWLMMLGCALPLALVAFGGGTNARSLLLGLGGLAVMGIFHWLAMQPNSPSNHQSRSSSAQLTQQPMNSNQTQSVRDPVCGMPVDPSATVHRHEHAGQTWYFCAAHCREQFAAHPETFLPKAEYTPSGVHRRSISREILIASAALVAVVGLAVMVRGITKSDAGPTTRTSTAGASAGRHEAVDDGSGGVIASATHTQAGEFVISLNTHTIDLNTFDPADQVKLHVGRQEVAPETVASDGEKSSHHQNYRITFVDPGQTAAVLSVHNVGGVGERKLPFSL